MKNPVTITHHSDIPKYKQIVESIQTAIENGTLGQGDILPSFNQIRDDFNVSRDTVIKAYSELKTLGLISSSPGKGNYVTGSVLKRKRNVFLLFDEFNAYKEILYNSIETTISGHGILDIYFHHYNELVFFDLINQSLGKYTDYVIMPLATPSSYERFRTIFENENVYILDRGGAPSHKDFPAVYQEFDKSIYNGLKLGIKHLEKYSKIIMELGYSDNPSINLIVELMRKAFTEFCTEFSFDHDIVQNVENLTLEPGVCFFVHDDSELVKLVKKIDKNEFMLGRDIGVISFNDTPLKEIAAGGITTISTDFELMGKTIGEMVLNRSKEHIQNPIRFIQRNSL